MLRLGCWSSLIPTPPQHRSHPAWWPHQARYSARGLPQGPKRRRDSRCQTSGPMCKYDPSWKLISVGFWRLESCYLLIFIIRKRNDFADLVAWYDSLVKFILLYFVYMLRFKCAVMTLPSSLLFFLGSNFHSRGPWGPAGPFLPCLSARRRPAYFPLV